MMFLLPFSSLLTSPLQDSEYKQGLHCTLCNYFDENEWNKTDQTTALRAC